MTLEEKRKEFELYLLSDECGWVDGREWMMGAHEINNLWQWIETKIDEACKKQRENAIEECAKKIEDNADKANDVLVEERHILAEDTVELFRNDIEFQRLIARKLRELKNAPSPEGEMK